MKSIFQEASSLGDAIEKAWEAVGSPEGFDVKVLKIGEKNFFGFCKVPYAVCVTALSGAKSSKNIEANSKVSADNCQSEGTCSSEKTTRPFTSSKYTAKDSTRSTSTRRPIRTPFVSKDKEIGVEEKNRVSDDVVTEVDNWIESDTLLARDYLKEVLEIIGLAGFEIRSSFENNYLNLIIVSREGASFLEKSFFICIAPLIVQMVKKSSGKNPKGLRIVISHVEE